VALILLLVVSASALDKSDRKGKDKGKDKDKGKKDKKSKKQPATLEVTVPEGARVGDQLDFVTPDGQGFYVKVPDGGKEGDRFKVTLPKGVKKARMKKFKVPSWRKPKGEGKDRREKGKEREKEKSKKNFAPVIGIDFGTQYIKIAVSVTGQDKHGDATSDILDGDPITLSLQGKRATPNVVSIYDDELAFGDAAVSLLPKLSTAFAHVKQMLGQRANVENMKPPTEQLPFGGPAWFAAMGLRYPFVEDLERGTVRLPIAAEEDAEAGPPCLPTRR
jgi:hypothetical protein